MFFERVVQAGRHTEWRRRERVRERVRDRMGEGGGRGHEEGGRMSLFRALIMNKTDSRGCVSACTSECICVHGVCVCVRQSESEQSKMSGHVTSHVTI